MSPAPRTRQTARRADGTLFELLQRRQDRRNRGVVVDLADARARLDAASAERERLVAALTENVDALRDAALTEALAALDLASTLPETSCPPPPLPPLPP